MVAAAAWRWGPCEHYRGHFRLRQDLGLNHRHPNRMPRQCGKGKATLLLVLITVTISAFRGSRPLVTRSDKEKAVPGGAVGRASRQEKGRILTGWAWGP